MAALLTVTLNIYMCDLSGIEALLSLEKPSLCQISHIKDEKKMFLFMGIFNFSLIKFYNLNLFDPTTKLFPFPQLSNFELFQITRTKESNSVFYIPINTICIFNYNQLLLYNSLFVIFRYQELS